MLPPGSPATISMRTELAERSAARPRISPATSSNRSAYVGVQQMTVGCSVSIIDRRTWLDMPPAGIQ